MCRAVTRSGGRRRSHWAIRWRCEWWRWLRVSVAWDRLREADVKQWAVRVAGGSDASELKGNESRSASTSLDWCSSSSSATNKAGADERDLLDAGPSVEAVDDEFEENDAAAILQAGARFSAAPAATTADASATPSNDGSAALTRAASWACAGISFNRSRRRKTRRTAQARVSNSDDATGVHVTHCSCRVCSGLPGTQRTRPPYEVHTSPPGPQRTRWPALGRNSFIGVATNGTKRSPGGGGGCCCRHASASRVHHNCAAHARRGARGRRYQRWERLHVDGCAPIARSKAEGKPKTAEQEQLQLAARAGDKTDGDLLRRSVNITALYKKGGSQIYRGVIRSILWVVLGDEVPRRVATSGACQCCVWSGRSRDVEDFKPLWEEFSSGPQMTKFLVSTASASDIAELPVWLRQQVGELASWELFIASLPPELRCRKSPKLSTARLRHNPYGL